MKLNWDRSREKPHWCSLRADDGRQITAEFWGRPYAPPLLCRVCQHPATEHERQFKGRVSTFNPAVTPCNYGNAGVACGCPDWVSPSRRTWVVDLQTEVRFRGLVTIENGRHPTRGVKRAAWMRTKVRTGVTVSRVMLYAMPLGSLLAVARGGFSLELKPTKRRYLHGRATIGAGELTKLSVAVDAALEAGEWAIESESGTSTVPGFVAQMEVFR